MNKSLKRRTFLRQGGAALAAPFILPRRGFAQDSSPNDRIVMGAIGVGGRGTYNMTNFLGRSEVQMVAACDVYEPHRERARLRVNDRYGNEDCASYNDFRELLDRDDIDAVCVGTPDHWHTLINVYAAQTGKDIYSEKPLTLVIDEGRILVNAVRRYGRVFQVGSQQRSSWNFRYACELVRSGKLGNIHTVTAFLPSGPTAEWPEMPQEVPEGLDWDMYLGPAKWVPYMRQRTFWDFRWFFDYSGGQMTDWGAHHFDIAQWGLGMDESGPVKIKGTATRPQDGPYETFIHFDVEFEYANGIKMIGTNPEHGTKFEGSEGWVHVWRGGLDAEPKDLLEETIGPNDVHLYESNDHHGNFLDCVRTRQRPICDVETGHRSVTCAHLANIACKLGRELRWDPEREVFIGDEQANEMRFRPYRAPWYL